MDRIPLQESRTESTPGYSRNTTGSKIILIPAKQAQHRYQTQVERCLSFLAVRI